MKYNFDRIIDRHHTNCAKWDVVGQVSGNPDAIPMWVADGDFQAPQPIIDMLAARVQHGVFGYPCRTPDFTEATKRWIKKQHGVELKKEWQVFTLGVVPIIYTAIQTFTEPGDEIIVQRPVYHPFMAAAEDLGRVVSNNALLYQDGNYSIDFDDLERRASNPKTKLMVFCNPHNPVGRAWTKEEVDRVCQICFENGVLLISDEIHSDLLFFGNKHHPAAFGNADFERNTIVCYAPTKTFNIAGLRGSCAVIPNEELRNRFVNQLKCNDSVQESLFSIPSYVCAYTECDEYLEQLLPYLEGNITYFYEFVQKNMPKIRTKKPEATYLMWLDCSALGLEKDALYDFFANRAGIAVNHGEGFGKEGELFVRINLACPRSVVEQACAQLLEAYLSLESM